MQLALTGDVMLGRLVNEYINQYSPEYPFGDIAALLRKADMSLINLECVIAKSGKELWPPKAFYFKADPIAIETLKNAKITCANLANNHTLDFQEEALLETLQHLDEAGIKHVGAGKNIEEAEKFLIIKKNGIKIGIAGFADYPKEWEAGSKAGINYIEISGKGIEEVRKAAKEMKEECDIAILTIHWGPNMRLRPTEEFRKFARRAIDSGIDIYHGHSAHIFQGIEIYKGKPIFYDAGDFVDDYYVGPEEKNDQQLLFLLDVDKDRVKKISLVPLIIYMCQVNKVRSTSHIFEEICQRMAALCKEMGTNVIRKKNHMEISLTAFKSSIDF